MPYYRRTLPLFTVSNPSRRESFTLPDYYRSTRIEQYGPYYRSSESARDLIKTIDLRGQESSDSICALPDIPEEYELQLHSMMFEVVGGGSVYNGPEFPYEREKKRKWLGWLWRLSSTMIHKCCGHQVEVRNAGRGANFDLSD
ncbi:hypothetical protein L208DRAFT_1406081 [Tricholoma matsutake]|nr:hypothetical protein L208DRAFT_1406081 [Tricholoma matsutake 945]